MFIKNKEKIYYIIVREDICSPLVKSQVLDVLKKNKKDKKNINIIWFYGVEKLIIPGYLECRKKQIKKTGLNAIFIPFISYRFPVTWWQIPFVLPQIVILMIFIMIIYGGGVIHARSYHAGAASLIINKLMGISYIFDPRSPFPEENIIAKGWGSNGINYKLWKMLESNIINKAAAVLLVSNELKYHYEVEIPSNISCYIPNNYPESFMAREQELIKITGERDLKETKIQFVYGGSLGHWNDYKLYVDFFASINRCSNHYMSLVMITNQRHHNEILSYGRSKGVVVQCIEVSQENILIELCKSSIGLYLMSNCDARLGVKTVEYLYAGLPMIVSSNIRGASSLISENNLGLCISEETTDEEIASFLESVISDRRRWFEKCHSFAKNNFSPDVISERLSDLYSRIM